MATWCLFATGSCPGHLPEAVGNCQVPAVCPNQCWGVETSDTASAVGRGPALAGLAHPSRVLQLLMQLVGAGSRIGGGCYSPEQTHVPAPTLAPFLAWLHGAPLCACLYMHVPPPYPWTLTLLPQLLDLCLQPFLAHSEPTPSPCFQDLCAPSHLPAGFSSGTSLTCFISGQVSVLDFKTVYSCPYGFPPWMSLWCNKDGASLLTS